MSSLLAAERGSRTPAVLHLPADRSTNVGDEIVDLASVAGLDLDDWQQDCITGASWRSSAGRWSSFENVVEVPRQNGKGGILRARQLGGLFVLGERLQIHTAHEFKTCYEHFRLMADLVESTPVLSSKLKPRVGIRTGAGDQAIELKNGNRIRFLARSRTSGRGFSSDCIYLDEAFELIDETLGALLPTLTARPDPQIWYTSSAPHSTSTVLHRLRARAVKGDDPRLFFAGWFNPVGTDLNDRDAWLRVNPATGIRIQMEDLESIRRSMSDDEWAREHMGIASSSDDERSIPASVWDVVCSPDVVPVEPLKLAVEVSPERESASLVVCGHGGGRVVELVDHRPGVSWVVDRVAQVVDRSGAEVVIDAGGPAGALLADLEDAGVNVERVGARDVVQACGAFFDGLSNRSIAIRTNDTLNRAAAAVSRRKVADAWAWSRSSVGGVDVTPIMAASLAAHGGPGGFFVY